MLAQANEAGAVPCLRPGARPLGLSEVKDGAHRREVATRCGVVRVDRAGDNQDLLPLICCLHRGNKGCLPM